MSKKIRIVWFAFLTVLFFLISCSGSSNASLGDTYHSGTDFQFYMTSNFNIITKIQETENGCVFFHNGFVYVYEQGSSIQPLCSKVNCLHDAEEDDEKKLLCNAFIGSYIPSGESDVTLMAYKDAVYVYYISSEDGKGRISRMSMDGLSRDEIAKTGDINRPILHRGYVYYYKLEYGASSESGISSKCSLCRVDITAVSPKEELVSTAEGAHGNGRIQAYGSHIYYVFLCDNGTRIVWGVYDIESGKTEILSEDGRVPNAFDGKTYWVEYDRSNDPPATVPLFQGNAFGDDGKAVIQDIEYDTILSYDGKHYFTNNAVSCQKDPELKKVFRVYDKNFEKVDEFTLPDDDTHVYDVPVGGEKYQYLIYNDVETGEWGLAIWDKSDIGTLKGQPIPQQKVFYKNSTADDVIPDGESQEEKISKTYTEKKIASLDQWPETPVEESLSREKDMDHIAECEISFTEDCVSLSTAVTEGYQINIYLDENGEPMEEMKVIGQNIVSEIVLYGYYVKGEDVYELALSYKNLKAPIGEEIKLDLPEKGEGFIGAKAEITISITQEYGTEEDIKKGKTPLTGGRAVFLNNARAGRVR